MAVVFLAMINLISMVCVFAPRAVPREAMLWVLFGFAVLATDLVWICLPLQVILALLFISGGALESGLGTADG